jgi:hypothetical protein
LQVRQSDRAEAVPYTRRRESSNPRRPLFCSRLAARQRKGKRARLGRIKSETENPRRRDAIRGLLLSGIGSISEVASPEGPLPKRLSLPGWLGSAPPSLRVLKPEAPGRLCCRLQSGVIVEHGNDLRVLVVLEADTIVVTIPGTSYSISYRKLHETPWLVASDVRDDPHFPITKFTFRARAWTAANDKARELGWIV